MRRLLLMSLTLAVLASGCGPATPTTGQGTGNHVPPTQPTPPKGQKPVME